MNSLVLARGVDLHVVVTIIVMVISVLSWFVNFVKGNSPDGKPRQEKPKPKPQTNKNDIEQLLMELAGNKRKPKPESEPRRQESTRPAAKSPVVRTKPKPPAAKPASAYSSTSQRPASRPGSNLGPSSTLGEGVRSHHLGTQIDATVQKEIVKAVETDLGKPLAVTTTDTSETHPLVKMLRDPKGVRQAVLLNEILQRPKALRG